MRATPYPDGNGGPAHIDGHCQCWEPLAGARGGTNAGNVSALFLWAQRARRVVGQLLTEGLVLGLAGEALGLALSPLLARESPNRTY